MEQYRVSILLAVSEKGGWRSHLFWLFRSNFPLIGCSRYCTYLVEHGVNSELEWVVAQLYGRKHSTAININLATGPGQVLLCCNLMVFYLDIPADQILHEAPRPGRSRRHRHSTSGRSSGMYSYFLHKKSVTTHLILRITRWWLGRWTWKDMCK